MISSSSSVRALLVYALVLPMALILGYLLASPTDFGTWATVLMVFLTLCAPLILAKHHTVLFLSWNMAAAVFFLPGQPSLWFVMAFGSLLVSVFQRALSKEMRFISVPSLVMPILFLAAVVFVTAKFTGGFGFRIFGSENIGGRRYLTLFAAMAGFFAMIAQRIPPEKAGLFVGVFFLGTLGDALGSLLPYLGPQLYFLFLIFPTDVFAASRGFGQEIVRYWGLGLAAFGVYFYLLARYGIQGTLTLKRPARLLLFISMAAVATGAGYRASFILLVLVFVTQFYFEGLLRTKYTLFLGAPLLLFCVGVIPFATELPLSVQRSLSILPINVSPVARFDAQASSEWRVEMWKILFPQVPEYLWLGKGLGISSRDLELASEMARRGRALGQETAILAGDYHSGPLTVIIGFGVWGGIGMVWFFSASIRALYLNYLYGDEALKKINTFLLACFVSRTVEFIFVYGSFYADFPLFIGIVGLSVALNHGIRRPSHAVVAVTAPAAAEPEAAALPAFARSSFTG